MRILLAAPFIFLAACSEGGDQAAQPKAEEAPATQLTAGQWEVTTEVTNLRQLDKGKPAINTPAGTKATHTSCVAEADAKKPKPALFVGDKGTCEYDSFYMSGGRINATAQCKRPGLNGRIGTLVNGSYKADSAEGTLLTETSLYGDGDVRIESKFNAKRVGACTPAS